LRVVLIFLNRTGACASSIKGSALPGLPTAGPASLNLGLPIKDHDLRQGTLGGTRAVRFYFPDTFTNLRPALRWSGFIICTRDIDRLGDLPLRFRIRISNLAAEIGAVLIPPSFLAATCSRARVTAVHWWIGILMDTLARFLTIPLRPGFRDGNSGFGMSCARNISVISVH
jgi:hypothetical protein